jgi:hypothetical protein
VIFCSCGIRGWWGNAKSVGEFSVVVSFKTVEDQFAWPFAGVYGPNTDGDRRFLWDELPVC